MKKAQESGDISALKFAVQQADFSGEWHDAVFFFAEKKPVLKIVKEK